MKCLLVDDEPGIREGMAMLLRRRGCEVRTAGSCQEAWEWLGSQWFDVIVTDWRLPDGEASDYVAGCTTPVVAVSGHPEEVADLPAIREVLVKPVSPTRLHEAIQANGATAALPATDDDDEMALPRAVREVLDDVLSQLPADSEVSYLTDDEMVMMRAELPAASTATVHSRGGDLRLLDNGGQRVLELRLFKDGRPESCTRIVRAGDAWPQDGSFAVDCRDLSMPPGEYEQWLDGVAKRRSSKTSVCLLAVPEALEGITAGWERTHDMPMRERIGPRLSAELIELWSEP